jgi:CheY-like chemotaxis protein
MRHSILVVEDNSMNRELVCDWLEAEGYEVWSTADLEGSYELLAKRLPNTVLLDINLGGDDGLDLIAWMGQKRAARHSRHCRDGTCSSDGARTDSAGRLQSVPIKTYRFQELRKQLNRWLQYRKTSQVDS